MSDEDVITSASCSATCAASFSPSCTVTDTDWNLISPPFRRCDELCKELYYIKELEKQCHLRRHGSNPTFPDAPRVRLDCPSEMISYCLEDLDTVSMNKLGEKLWMASSNPEIASLSQHLVLERRIQVTEDPSVHLLWTGTDGIIYIKPLPAYLTSFAFWEYLLDLSNSEISSEERSRLKATTLGFLKTYASLIQRRSDFIIARRHDLLASFGDVSFERFIAFISSFDSVPVSAISSRWRFGLLRLDALNFHSVIHLRRWHLNRFESRYGAYFQRFFPVVLFIFALFSVVLSAMRVIIGAKQIGDTDNKGLKQSIDVFVWTGTEAISWAVAFGLIFVVWWIGISAAEACKRRSMRNKVKKRLKEECVASP